MASSGVARVSAKSTPAYFRLLLAAVLLVIGLLALSMLAVGALIAPADGPPAVAITQVVDDEVRSTSALPTRAACAAYVTGDLVGDANPAVVDAARCQP